MKKGNIKTFFLRTSIFNSKVFYVRGQTLIILAILFMAVSSTVVLGLTSPIVRQFKIVGDLEMSKKSYFTAEAGGEDAYYRIKNLLLFSFPMTLSLDGASTEVSVSTTGSNQQEILSRGNANNHIRTVVKDITVTDGFSFNFAVQVGLGGLRMMNNSKVIGNVYSSGPILGDSNSANVIVGDVVSAGSLGSISTIRATSSAFAHNIADSVIDKNAHYQNISNTTVGGQLFPGSADLPLVPMPIPDSLLDQWEDTALAGGVINTPCPYNINASMTIGPIKIDCDVTISGNATEVILAGAVWINGNLTINNNPRIKVSDSVGNKSVPIIARSVSNPLGKGIIAINNNPTFYGSETGGVPNPDSYVMFVSRNTSNESGGSVVAITAGNNVTGNMLLYAPHGEIELSNNVILREVTAYQLTLKNNTEVIYNVGLAQPLFTSGPGGEWKIQRWKEVE